MIGFQAKCERERVSDSRPREMNQDCVRPPNDSSPAHRRQPHSHIMMPAIMTVISVKGEQGIRIMIVSLFWSFNRIRDMRKDGTAEGMTGSLITLSHILILSPISPSL